MTSNRSAGPGPPSEHAAAIVLIRLTVVAGLLGGLARTWADPDLWGHVRFGADLIRDRVLTRTDPYSFTSDVPWVNHEWLAEAAMAVAFRAGGGAGLVALKMGLIAVTLASVYAAVRHTLVGGRRDVVLFAAAIGLWARVFVVRPQIFSIALFAILLWVLVSAEPSFAKASGAKPGRGRGLWLLPPIFAVWVNLHGGWIVGLGVLGLWIAASLSPWRRGTTPVPVLLGVGILTLVATLLNPYGAELWSFLAATVRVARPNINDWRPLWESDAQVIVPWLITLGVAAFALARGGRRVPPAHAALAIGLGLASIKVNRLDVFFTLAVAVLLGPYLQSTERPRSVAPVWTRRTLAAGAVLALIVSAVGWRERAALGCVRLDGPWMPEREAGARVASEIMSGRLLTWFDWGQYVIWQAGPRLQVSIDGRRETVYSDAFVARHLTLYFQPEQAADLLDALHPDIAWLPADLPLTRVLDRAGWHRRFTGPRSVILTREAMGSMPIPPLRAAACFPGP